MDYKEQAAYDVLHDYEDSDDLRDCISTLRFEASSPEEMRELILAQNPDRYQLLNCIHAAEEFQHEDFVKPLLEQNISVYDAESILRNYPDMRTLSMFKAYVNLCPRKDLFIRVVCNYEFGNNDVLFEALCAMDLTLQDFYRLGNSQIFKRIEEMAVIFQRLQPTALDCLNVILTGRDIKEPKDMLLMFFHFKPTAQEIFMLMSRYKFARTREILSKADTQMMYE